MITSKKSIKKAPPGTQFVQVPVYRDLLQRIDADRKQIGQQDLNHCTRAKFINQIFREYYDARPLALAVNGAPAGKKPAAVKRKLKAEAVA